MTTESPDPVDLAVLSQQTGADAGLQREVLALFAEDASQQVALLRSADLAERKAIAHRLVGSARAIGAADVARLAAAVEAGRGDLASLEAAIERVREFISAHLAGAGHGLKQG